MVSTANFFLRLTGEDGGFFPPSPMFTAVSSFLFLLAPPNFVLAVLSVLPLSMVNLLAPPMVVFWVELLCPDFSGMVNPALKEACGLRGISSTSTITDFEEVSRMDREEVSRMYRAEVSRIGRVGGRTLAPSRGPEGLNVGVTTAGFELSAGAVVLRFPRELFKPAAVSL